MKSFRFITPALATTLGIDGFTCFAGRFASLSVAATVLVGICLNAVKFVRLRGTHQPCGGRAGAGQAQPECRPPPRGKRDQEQGCKCHSSRPAGGGASAIFRAHGFAGHSNSCGALSMLALRCIQLHFASGKLSVSAIRPVHSQATWSATQRKQRRSKRDEADRCAEPMPGCPARQLGRKRFVRDACFGKAGVGALKVQNVR